MMKKCFIKGLMFLAVITAGTGVFSSCKDINEDMQIENEMTQNDLQEQINALKTAQDLLTQAQAQCKADCAAARAALEISLKAYADAQDANVKNVLLDSIEVHANRLADLEARVLSIEQTYVTITTFEAAIDQLDARDDVLSDSIKDLDTKVASLVTLIEGKVDTTDFNALAKRVQDLEDSTKLCMETYRWMSDAKLQIAALDSVVGELQSADSLLNERIDTIGARVDSLQIKYDSLEVKLGDAIDSLNVALTDIDSLQSAVSLLNTAVAANTTAIAILQGDIAALKERVTKLETRIEKLITGISVQAAKNPIFGYINTPTGIRTNILMGQYGYASCNYTFPSQSTAAEYNNNPAYLPDVKDMEMLQLSGNFTPLTVAQGETLMDGENGNINVGTIYMTINPNNIDFTGGNLTLVNTQDASSGVTLDEIKKSDEVLTFGMTRAANNGFYEAKAYVKEADIATAALSINVSELEASAKNVINNPLSPNSYISFLTDFVQSFNNKLPAYGLRAGWMVDGTEYAVYSDYNVAATVYKPLSFKFLAGTNAPSIPTISPLSGFQIDKSILDAFNISIAPINPNFTIAAITIGDMGNLQVTITGFPEDDGMGGVSFTGTKVVDVPLDQVETELGNVLNSAVANIETSVNQLITDLNNQIQSAMAGATGDIKDSFGDIIDNLNGKLDGLFDTANGFIDRINAVVGRVNNILNDPNHLLQVAVVYQNAAGQFGLLSNTRTMPTEFVLSGGNAISLYATSYSAELIAPAFKKFVAVTDVWESGKETNSAQNGDATCRQLLKDANTSGVFNQAVSGKSIRVPMKVSQAGYTYEILYSAMDYHGVTSTCKYYVKVK